MAGNWLTLRVGVDFGGSSIIVGRLVEDGLGGELGGLRLRVVSR